MKLSVREDIDAGKDRVYAAVTDFAAFERLMLRRGVEVSRDETTPLNQVGAQWHARYMLRGREQVADAELVSLTPGAGFVVDTKSSGIVCHAGVSLIELSKTRTRLLVSLDMRATTLASRLLIQSLKLGKSNLTQRLQARVSQFAETINS